MSWELIVSLLANGTVVATVGVLFKLIEKRVDSSLKQAEKLHASTLETASAIDIDLRQRRIEVYNELWALTSKISLWPRNHALSYGDLNKLTEDLCDWYFKPGGMYLSEDAQKAYCHVQQCITKVISHHPDGPKVTDEDYVEIHEKCSTLRTELTRDLLSRRKAPTL